MVRKLVPYFELSVFILIVIAGGLLRLSMLETMSESVLGCKGCVIPGWMQSDLPLLSLIVVTFCVGQLINSRLLSFLFKAFAALAIIIYWADILVMQQFATRLSISDIYVYLEQTQVALTFIGQLQTEVVFAVVFAFLLLLFISIGRSVEYSYRPFCLSVSVLLGGIAVSGSAFITPPEYVHRWAVVNVVEANLGNQADQRYSNEYLSRIETDGTFCQRGEGARENIIILVVESWSSYHSDLWSGINNWTPRLDSIAQQGLQLTRLHAGGYNTNQGLISLLAGREFDLPLATAGDREAFSGAWDLKNTLPDSLNREGYNTFFMTSGDLSFTNKGPWLKSIGFQGIEGHEYAGYEGAPRMHFNSVPDDWLYNRAAEVVGKQLLSEKPFFTVIENVSTHHPYRHPYTEENSEESVFRFADEAAAVFIDQLRAMNFFEEGVLVVVSDHRAMTFVSTEEVDLLGRSAASRIPGFIISGNNPASVNSALLHQSDIGFSLLNRVADQVCSNSEKTDLFSVRGESGRCIMHARGDHRDKIDVFCPAGEGTVIIAGDDSYFESSRGLDASVKDQLLLKIARVRVN